MESTRPSKLFDIPHWLQYLHSTFAKWEQETCSKFWVKTLYIYWVALISLILRLLQIAQPPRDSLPTSIEHARSSQSREPIQTISNFVFVWSLHQFWFISCCLPCSLLSLSPLPITNTCLNQSQPQFYFYVTLLRTSPSQNTPPSNLPFRVSSTNLKHHHVTHPPCFGSDSTSFTTPQDQHPHRRSDLLCISPPILHDPSQAKKI